MLWRTWLFFYYTRDSSLRDTWYVTSTDMYILFSDVLHIIWQNQNSVLFHKKFKKSGNCHTVIIFKVHQHFFLTYYISEAVYTNFIKGKLCCKIMKVKTGSHTTHTCSCLEQLQPIPSTKKITRATELWNNALKWFLCKPCTFPSIIAMKPILYNYWHFWGHYDALPPWKVQCLPSPKVSSFDCVTPLHFMWVL